MSLDAAQHRSGKGSGDENFPVASWVVAPPHRRPILSFYEFVRIADDISDHAEMKPADKLAHLDSLEGSLLGHNTDNAAGVISGYRVLLSDASAQLLLMVSRGRASRSMALPHAAE